MADANCDVAYTTEEDCCAVDLALPVTEPPPEPIPPEVPPNSKFAYAFNFGDSLSNINWGTSVPIVSPYTGIATRWRARNAGDLTSSVVFAINKASGVLGNLVSVGGTQPGIVTAKGAEALSIDWTTPNISAGDVLEVTYVSGDSKGVTIVIEFDSV